MKILFVCNGNQFRSPIAKALYNKYKKDDSVAEAYGLIVEKEEKIGRNLLSFPSFQIILETLKEKEGIDNSNEICKQLTSEILQSADKVVFLDIEQVPEEYKDRGYIYWHIKDFNSDDLITKEMLVAKIEEIKNMVLGLINQESWYN